MPIAKLTIDLEARLGAFETELKRISSVADGMASKLAGSFDKVRSAASAVIPVLGGLGAAFTLASFADSIAGTIKFAAALDDMAERTGASVENLSALAGVARIGGHDMGMVEQSVIKLNKALHGSDDESKGAAKAIAALGLSVEELRAKDPAEAMLDVAKALDKFADGGGKSAVAMAILGKAGAQALPYLKDLAEKGELVGKITAEQAAQAEQYEKNMNKLSAALSSASKAMALEMLPALTRLSAEMAEGIGIAGGFWAALAAGATINPFKTTGDNIRAIKAEIADMEREQTEYGYLDEGKYKRKQAQLKMLKATQIREALGDDPAANMDANDRKFARKLSLDDFVGEKEKKDKTPKGPKEKDDYSKIIAALNEKIAVEQLNIDTVGKATAAEKDYAKFQADVASGAVKLTAEQKRVIESYYGVYIARQKDAKAADEFNKGVEKQTEAMQKQREALIDQVRHLNEEAELYGLTDRALASVTVSRLEDAVATARQNGAGAEQIAYLEEELALRREISEATDKKSTAAILSQTDDAKQKKIDADKALLARKLASGDITRREYEQGLKVIESSVDEMGEFMKQAARNMQDAFADFLFDPFSDGVGNMARKFGQAVQRMIAEAASAQLLKLLLGDMGKTGELGGWVGSIFKGIGGSGDSGWMSDSSWFANGGIMTSAGPLPLNTYAGGGVADRPQLAIFGDGRKPEAYVPLPDGRHIPVAMSGGGGQLNQTLNFYGAVDPPQVKRAAASGARQVLGVASGARRYG